MPVCASTSSEARLLLAGIHASAVAPDDDGTIANVRLPSKPFGGMRVKWLRGASVWPRDILVSVTHFANTTLRVSRSSSIRLNRAFMPSSSKRFLTNVMWS